MIGIDFSQYNMRLTPVSSELNENPIKTVVIPEFKKKAFHDYMNAYYDTDDFEKVAHFMDYDVLSLLGKESIAKISSSTIYTMCDSVEKQFKSDPELRLYYKIKNSMWRWGCGRGNWNEIADSYNSILSFDLDVEGFSVALDYTTWVNEKGYSEHSRKYLDGVFAYNVHYHGNHVMTIGFSVAADYSIFIQQIQNTSPKGNRWMFRMPRNILEHIIDRFVVAFKNHRIYISEPEDQVTSTVSSYQRGLATGIKRNIPEDILCFQEKLENIASRKDSIISFYRNTGRYIRGEEKTSNGLRHYRLTLSN